MFAGILKGFLFLGVIYWYSTGVWRLIDKYFKNEFVSYLETEFEKNAHLKVNKDNILDFPFQPPDSDKISELSSSDTTTDETRNMLSKNNDQFKKEIFAHHNLDENLIDRKVCNKESDTTARYQPEYAKLEESGDNTLSDNQFCESQTTTVESHQCKGN